MPVVVVVIVVVVVVARVVYGSNIMMADTVSWR